MPAIPQPFSHKPVSEWIQRFQQSTSADERLQALQAVGLRADAPEISKAASLALKDTDPTIRALGARQLSAATMTILDDTKAQLMSLLTDSDPDVRFESARTLVRHRCSPTDQILRVMLEFLDETETQPLMLAAVLQAFVQLDLSSEAVEQQLLPRLMTHLAHDRAEVREAIAVAFARWPEIARTVVEKLLPLLEDSEPVVREKIAFVLGQLGIKSESIQQALVTASQDEDSEVARIAKEALERLA